MLWLLFALCLPCLHADSSAEDQCSAQGGCPGIEQTSFGTGLLQTMRSIATKTEVEGAEATGDSGFHTSQEAGCTWVVHNNRYSGGYAGGESTKRTLDAAKAACLHLGAQCNAVTCESSACTIRGSPVFNVSPSGETTYEPSAPCFEAVGCLLHGIDYFHNDISEHTDIGSAEACQALCQTVEACIVFSWIPSESKCCLKTSDEGINKNGKGMPTWFDRGGSGVELSSLRGEGHELQGIPAVGPGVVHGHA